MNGQHGPEDWPAWIGRSRQDYYPAPAKHRRLHHLLIRWIV